MLNNKPGVALRKYLWTVLVLIGAAIFPMTGFAAEPQAKEVASYPNRTVRMIIPFPPGGPTDLLARLLAIKLSESWGQQVLPENRPGAAGAIGIAAASKAPPDGHTILIVRTALLMYRLNDEQPWDPLLDFIPVTNAATSTNVVIVNPGLQVRTLKDLVAYAKANPGKLSYGTAGAGTTPHLSMEFLRVVTGTNMQHVPYQGAGPAVTAVAADQVPVGSIGSGPAVQFIQSGRVRAIATTGAVRAPSLPDVPTFLESGFNLTTDNFNGVILPARTAAGIVARVHSDVLRVLQMADVRQRLSAMGLEPVGNSQAEFTKTIVSEIAQWRKLVKEAGIKIE